MAISLRLIITFFIMIGVTLGFFELFPMETTTPNEDIAIIFSGLVVGSCAYFYMDYVKMFAVKK